MLMVINIYVVLCAKKGARVKVCPLHRVNRSSWVGEWKVLILIMFHNSLVGQLDMATICFSAFVLIVVFSQSWSATST